MSDAYTIVIRRVYVKTGESLEIGLNGDGIGIEIRPTDEKSREYFGPQRLDLSRELCLQVADALRECALEMAS